jgi:tetrahydromethanopterin S-methyltransferase subunit A
MKNLIALLYGYLTEYNNHNEILNILMDAEIHHVTKDSLSVIWKNGMEEHLKIITNQNGIRKLHNFKKNK